MRPLWRRSRVHNKTPSLLNCLRIKVLKYPRRLLVSKLYCWFMTITFSCSTILCFILLLKNILNKTSFMRSQTSPVCWQVHPLARAMQLSSFFLSISSAITSVEPQNLRFISVITAVRARLSIHQFACTWSD